MESHRNEDGYSIARDDGELRVLYKTANKGEAKSNQLFMIVSFLYLNANAMSLFKIVLLASP